MDTLARMLFEGAMSWLYGGLGLLALGLIFKKSLICYAGFLCLCVATVGFVLSNNFGGGLVALGLEILVLWAVLRLIKNRINPTAAPAVVAPGAAPANQQNTIIKWVVLVILGFFLLQGATGQVFPGSSLADPIAKSIGETVYQLISRNLINLGYFFVLAIGIAAIAGKKFLK